MSKGSSTSKQSIAGRWMQTVLILGVMFFASPVTALACGRQGAQSEVSAQIRRESKTRSFRFEVFSTPAADQTTPISGDILHLFSHLHFAALVKLKAHQHIRPIPAGKSKTRIFLLHHSTGDDPDATR